MASLIYQGQDPKLVRKRPNAQLQELLFDTTGPRFVKSVQISGKWDSALVPAAAPAAHPI